MSPGMQILMVAVMGVALMAAGWQWQRRHRNAGIVDVMWTAGVGLGAVLTALTGPGAVMPRLLLAVLGGVWAGRLALHIWRRVRDGEEDGRYRALRAHWNGSQTKFALFFLAQAGLIVLFTLPFIAVAANPIPGMTPWLWLGLLIWIVAVAGESLADRQLAAFRADAANAGRVCQVGLWRVSRHPNYFFEWLHWFTYVALAVGASFAWLAWVGPVVMFIFLRWISGIPYTEAQSLRTRGEAYREYQRTTPMLFPWFPKPASAAGSPPRHAKGKS